MAQSFAFTSHSQPIAIAHRGGNAAGQRKENTLVAFQSAYKLGYRYFETDVILSLDGKVIVYHGLRSNRKAQKAGWPKRSTLQAMTYQEIQATIRIDGEPLPTLEELLITFPDVYFNIDPKTPEVVKPLGDLLQKLDARQRICIGSFVYKRTQQVAGILGGQSKVCTALTGSVELLCVGLARFVAAPLGYYLSRTNAACLELPQYLITKKLIKTAHAHNLKVYVWTVNNKSDMEKMLNRGVDGIMTDEIELLQRVLKTY